MGFSLQEFFTPWLKWTPEARERFLRDPLGATWFRASIPREMRISNERLQKCPALGGSGSEFIANHVAILGEHGIRVPEADVTAQLEASSGNPRASRSSNQASAT